MQISLDTGTGAYNIRSYSAMGTQSEIKINDRTLHHSLIVTPTQLIEPWRPNTLQALQASDLEVILALHPEIVLLGTGSQMQFPAPALLAIFLEKKIGIEFMDTGAACRTFNVLTSEGRNVAAALLIK
jgi:uncharacterized protein